MALKVNSATNNLLIAFFSTSTTFGLLEVNRKVFFFFPDSPRMVENKRQFTVAANIHLAQREKFVYIMKSLNNENDFKVSLLAQVSW